VLKLDVARKAPVRARVTRALKAQGIEIIRSRQLESVARGAGASLSSGAGLTAVATELGLSAFVAGEVSARRAKLTVRNGADGAVIGEAAFAGANPRKLAKEVARGFWRRLGGAVQQGKPHARARSAPPPPAAEPEPAEEASDDEADDKAGPDESEQDEDSSQGSAGTSAAHDRGAAHAPASQPRAAGAARLRAPRDALDREPEVTTRADAPSDLPDESPASGAAPARPAFDLAVGFRAFSRDLTFHEQAAGTGLSAYHLPVGPAVAVDLVWYPAAPFTKSKLAQLGLDAHVEKAFAVDSAIPATRDYPTGASFPTDSHEYAGGLRYRILVGSASEIVLPIVEIGERVYSVRSSSQADRSMTELPDVVYRYARGGVEARVALPFRLSLFGGGGYRYVLNQAGPIHDDFFPHLHAQGVDAHAGASCWITTAMEVRVAVDFQRYFYDMRSQDGDLYVAGGAVDQYVTYTVGAAFTLGR